MSMPLPAERLSSFSFWGMSSPLSRARYRSFSFWGMSSPLSRAHYRLSFWGMSSQLRTAVRLDLWWFQAGSVLKRNSNCLTDGLDVSPLGGFCGSSWIFSHSGHHCKGRASITPLTIRGLPMSMPLPSERRSVFSFWGMSSPLSRARYR